MRGRLSPSPTWCPCPPRVTGSGQAAAGGFTAPWRCSLPLFLHCRSLSRVRQELPQHLPEVDSLPMKRRGPALRQKHRGSWLPPGPKTERLKKSRSQSALRRPKGRRRQRPPTCSPLSGCDGDGHLSNPVPCGPCTCPGEGACPRGGGV